MSLKILLITSTDREADALRKTKGIIMTNDNYRFGSLDIELLIGGVGIMSTAWTLSKWLFVNEKPDLAMNFGIAGSYLDQFPVGCVVMPVSDCFADAGIEDGDNYFTLFEAGLSQKDEFPFTDGVIRSPNSYCEKLQDLLNPVNALTVNTSTGSERTKQRLSEKFNPAIETMEGAAFFYICAKENIPFVALRSVSNMVERRAREKWNIPLAIENMAVTLEAVFKKLDK